MRDMLMQTIIVAYSGIGALGIIAYWSTIKDLYKFKKESANITSYLIWTATSGIAFLYSSFILADMLFKIISGINFVACISVLLLSLHLKKSHKIPIEHWPIKPIH